MKSMDNIQKRQNENYDNEMCKNCKGLENCSSFGYIKLEKELDGKIYEVYEKCSKRIKFETELKYQKTIRSSGLPKEYLDKTFDNFDDSENKPAIKTIKNFLEKEEWKEGKGLVIVGDTGVGKTHLASAIVHELAKRDVFVLFTYVPDLLDEIRYTYDEDADNTADELLDLIYSAPVLILDDLGSEKPTEWAIEKITQILNYRWNNKLSTIATTNLTKDELKNRIGDRAYSRLMGRAEIIPLIGFDRRINKRGDKK